MNKRINRIISSTVIVTAVSMTGINSNLTFGITQAYAASYKLTNIEMSGAKLYENSNYTKELKSGDRLKDTYYAKLSSDKSKVSIDITGVDEECVSIIKTKSGKTYKPGKDIPILTGKTTLKVIVYEDAEKKKEKKTYKIIIKRYTKEEEEEIKNDDQSDIYLQTLELDYGDTPIGFRFNKTTYDVAVDPDIKTIAVKAVPEDGAYDVRINGIKVDENNDYKKNVSLYSKGTTTVEITLSYDDEEYRKYTINITKKDKTQQENIETTESSKENNNKNESSTTEIDNKDKNQNDTNTNLSNTQSSNTVNNSNPAQSNKIGWIKDAEKWKYNDDYGNALKNTWFYDRNYGKSYYFNNDGYMVTGWQKLNNSWYYLDNSGAMVTGWQKIGTSWYYLDYDGRMKTGWFKDSDGKYYYFYTSGQMASSTTINGYKLGADGAWIYR